ATLTGRVTRSVNVGSGSTCIVNASVSGIVTVAKGASIDIENSTIGGGLVAGLGPGAVRVCGSRLGGAATVAGDGRLVVIGDPGDAACRPNRIGGTLLLMNNTGGVEAIGNDVATVTASNNSGPGPYPGDPTTIGGNVRPG
ncbi:MAG: hypothetical protein M3N98_00295, partial [Actinomycetota bacterium]|nr:hypothetical protein [Actinomycetota bacterium]